MATPVETPQGCTNLKLRQASRLVTRHYEAFVAPTGLKVTQYSLLSHVVKLGPIGAGELAAAMRLTASTLSRNLQPLLAQGLGRRAGRCRRPQPPSFRPPLPAGCCAPKPSAPGNAPSWR